MVKKFIFQLVMDIMEPVFMILEFVKIFKIIVRHILTLIIKTPLVKEIQYLLEIVIIM